MICIVSRNDKFVKELNEALTASQVAVSVLDPNSISSIHGLYAEGVTGIVVDESIAVIPGHAWIDLLGSLGRRIPVLINADGVKTTPKNLTSENSDLLTYMNSPSVREVLGLLLAAGSLKKFVNAADLQAIPQFNTQVALHLLKATGALSILTINATAFREVAINYGVEAYQDLQNCFQSILKNMHGTPGCFRRTDMVMRRNPHSNTYYVFLEQSRRSHTVPAPGVLEKMADRLAVRLQKELWEEFFKYGADRKLPDCLKLIPDVSVGYATALHNPCVDPYETVEHIIEASGDVSKVQLRRIRDRACELLHALIQTKDLLHPNYQAVFTLPTMTQEMVDKAQAGKSIAPLMSHLYGFESLIRVRAPIAEETLSGDHLVHMEPRVLRPDILFALAHRSNVALELDQVCLQLGVSESSKLPGRLMVNVLPRNLLHIERLEHLLKGRQEIVFEMSESEGVDNENLMLRVRDYIYKMGCSIAADDFGKGYASIDRVINMKPEIIKLDRSLVKDIHKDPAKQAFVLGIVKAAKLASSAVLAEGVELWDEAVVMQRMGVDLIQGFLCHRPQSVEVIEAQIKQTVDDDAVSKLDSVA